jgi:hypothetical protein
VRTCHLTVNGLLEIRAVARRDDQAVNESRGGDETFLIGIARRRETSQSVGRRSSAGSAICQIAPRRR